MSGKTRIVAIVGPTSSGKTALGISAAKLMRGEVISADSRQVYRGLNLGTGKVTAEEADGVPHHLINVADPRDRFTVHDFVVLARAAIRDIAKRGKLPIVVGGTGLYIDSLLGRQPLNAPPPDHMVRQRLKDKTLEELCAQLKAADQVRYARVDLNNRRRVERALEIVLSTPLQTGIIYDTNYDVAWIGLTLPTPELKEKIKTRLAERLAAGMLDEARHLLTAGLTYERMEELGLEYRYMARHLSGALTYNEMVATLGSEIYKYAKRQMTWFKRNPDITWISPQEGPSLLRTLADRYTGQQARPEHPPEHQ